MEDIKEPKAGTPVEDIKEPKKESKVEEKPQEPKKESKKEPKVEEPKKEEPQEPKNPTEEGTVDINQLKAELEEANKKVAEVEALNGTVAALQKEAESKDAIIKEYEDLVGKMVETKLSQVPEEYRELIPDNLNLKQKLSWLEKAEAKGLFTKEEKKKPNVEIGKPLNVDVPQVDTGKLTGSQLLRMAYNTVKK